MADQNFSPTPQDDKPEAVSLTETSTAIRKLDNFWYHYKWPVIVTVFFAAVLVIGVVQFFTRPQYDSFITIATHYRMNSAEYADFEALITNVLPEDFDGNGEKSINIIIYQYYSEEEIEEARAEYARPNEYGETDRFQINLQYNSTEYKNFNDHTITGETSVYIISPALYQRLLENDRLMPLAELYPDGELPEGARSDGVGINLKSTDFYRYNAAAQVIPDTAILCLHRPTVGGRSSNKTTYEHEKEFFRAIADYQVIE